MAHEPLRRSPSRQDPLEPTQPKIWAEGGQRPPFDLRATGRAALYLSRAGVTPLLASSARMVRRMAINVKDGTGRIPAGKLGWGERFVPSHLRVAGWIKNTAAILSHASATTDTDIKRGNALVVEIGPHLWGPVVAAPPPPLPEPTPEPAAAPIEVAPVTLAEPMGEYDPLASIRDKLAQTPPPDRASPDPTDDAADQPPDPPGPMAETAIQMAGYGLGWASAIAALPYGLAHALWLYAKGTDLRGIGIAD